LTPFGTSIVSYYRDTLLNGAFRDFVTEWQPVTSIPFLAALLVIYAGIMLWSFVRHPRQTTLWERCALLCLLVAAVTTVRNIAWFGIAATALLPLSIDAALRARLTVQRLWPRTVVALGGCAVLALAVSVVVAIGRPESAYEHDYPARMQRAVAGATTAQPSLKVMSDAKYADWLLWKQPQLRGRLAYDARFELLTAAQLTDLVAFSDAKGAHWKRVARGYDLLVLDAERSSDEERTGKPRALRRRPWRRHPAAERMSGGARPS
jgi:drug/metabolite transporter superfamily protein YnfA